MDRTPSGWDTAPRSTACGGRGDPRHRHSCGLRAAAHIGGNVFLPLSGSSSRLLYDERERTDTVAMGRFYVRRPAMGWLAAAGPAGLAVTGGR